MTDEHLSVDTIAAYADDALDAATRARADEHLAVCAVCRGELSEVTDLIVDVPSARRGRRWLGATSVLAAAGIVALVVALPARTSISSPTAERATAPSASALMVIAPAAEGAPVSASGGAIVWRAVEPRATYRVTVTDTTGGTRWTTETPDTAVTLPASARLEPGARYYFYVDALRADGWSVQSGPRTFTTAP